MIVLFGGSFDPFHNGHMSVLQALMQHASPEAAIHIMPYFDSAPKHPNASADHRKSMIEELLAANFHNTAPSVSLNDIELNQHKLTYSIDTVRSLKASTGSSIRLVIGFDQYQRFSTWQSPFDLLDELDLLYVVSRPGFTMENPQLPSSYLPKVFPIYCKPVPISSHHIRDAVRNKQPYEHHVPMSIAAYIKTHHLYE
jgi:nicotinate-nucleotide adenylyltransferase